MASFRLENGTLQQLMTAELNALANNARAVDATLFDNSAAGNDFPWADFELLVQFGTAPTTGTIDLYALESVDGTNYSWGDASNDPPFTSWLGSWTPIATTSAQRLVLRNIPLPPGKFKLLLKNNATGQAFAATGNIISMLPYRIQSV